MSKKNNNFRKGRLIPIIIVLSLFATILIASSLSYLYVTDTSENFQNQIDEIKKSVQTDDWAISVKNSNILFDGWEREKPLMSILIDHRRMEMVEVLISRSRDFVKNQDKTDSLVELNQTAQQLHGISESEFPSLSNIF